MAHCVKLGRKKEGKKKSPPLKSNGSLPKSLRINFLFLPLERAKRTDSLRNASSTPPHPPFLFFLSYLTACWLVGSAVCSGGCRWASFVIYAAIIVILTLIKSRRRRFLSPLLLYSDLLYSLLNRKDLIDWNRCALRGGMKKKPPYPVLLSSPDIRPLSNE